MRKNILELLQQAQENLQHVDEQLIKLPSDLRKRMKVLVENVREKELIILEPLLQAALALGWRGYGDVWCFDTTRNCTLNHKETHEHLLRISGRSIYPNSKEWVVSRPEVYQDLTRTLFGVLEGLVENLSFVDQLNQVIDNMESKQSG